jgi:hypothetical protein
MRTAGGRRKEEGGRRKYSVGIRDGRAEDRR